MPFRIWRTLDRFGEVSPARSRATIFGGFALLVLGGVGALLAVARNDTSSDRVTHTLEVQRIDRELIGALWATESAQRSLLLTGKSSYADRYSQLKTRIEPLLAALRRKTADNPAQQARLNELEPLFAERLDALERGIALNREQGSQAAANFVAQGGGAAVMERIARTIEVMNAEEDRLLLERQAAVARERALVVGMILLCVLGAGALAFYVGLIVRRYTLTLEAQNEALANEIREREQAEGQLRQTQKMEALGRLTGGIAHDFNNMLAIISGNLELIGRSIGEGEDRLERLLANAREGTERAALLTRRLLAFTRQQPLDPRSVDLNQCVAQMSEMMRRVLGTEIKIETVLAGGLWRALIDLPQLESTVLNLAINARDAMNGVGKLTIETSNTYLDRTYAASQPEVSPGQYVLIAITDTGSGMSPEVMAQAFEPFFTTKAKGLGTGLGLSQVHGFVKQSGGHIKLYSEVGVGTTVKIYLPRDAMSAGSEPARAQAGLATGAVKQSLAVLVVEDEEGVREFVAGALTELGHSVLLAATAEEALNLLGAHPQITVLLTDVVMPHKNGRALAEEARMARPDIAVVFMTGYTRNAIVHNGVLDSGVHLLTKPFTIAELSEEIESALVAAEKTEAQAVPPMIDS